MKVFVCFLAIVAVCCGQAETQVEENCDRACAMNYEPVCCTYADGSTLSHGNACSAAVYHCKEKITPATTVDGECTAEVEQPTEPACPEMMCLEMYDPVCCTYADGSTRTFGSACEASNINCQEGKTCENQSKGECQRFHILPFPYRPYPKRPYIFVPIDTPVA